MTTYVTTEEAKANAVFDYYDALLGTRFRHTHNLDLQQLGLPQADLSSLILPFSEE